MQEILFTGIIFMAVGIFILFVIPAAERYRVFYAGMPVNAVVCGRKEKTVNGKKKVNLIWQFTYEGNERQYRSHYWHLEDERNIGYRGALLLSKNNTKKVYEFMPAYIKTMSQIAGIMLMVIGMIFIIVFFHMRGTIKLI